MHIVTGKMNHPAKEFQAGESTGFNLSLGEQVYNRETKMKEWTNYRAVIFSNKPGQIDFYRNSLVKGSIISLKGKSLILKEYNGKSYIEMNDCHVDIIESSTQAQEAPPPAQQGFQSQPQGFNQPQQPIQQGAFNRNQPQQPGAGDFDDDITF